MNSQNYAKALSSCFEKDQKEGFFLVLKDLKKGAEVLNSAEAKRFFLCPVISLKDKKAFLKKVFKLCDFKILSQNFLLVLLENKRWGFFEDILKKLSKKEEDLKSLVAVEVETPQPLSLALKEELAKNLKKFFQKDILLKEKPCSPALKGGIRIKAKGLIFDDTLRFHLKLMENQIKEQLL